MSVSNLSKRFPQAIADENVTELFDEFSKYELSNSPDKLRIFDQEIASFWGFWGTVTDKITFVITNVNPDPSADSCRSNRPTNIK